MNPIKNTPSSQRTSTLPTHEQSSVSTWEKNDVMDRQLHIYWNKILEGKNLFNSPEELFLFRLSAYRYIAHFDQEIQKKARKFLLSTMLQNEVEYNFKEKETFIGSISQWCDPIIVSTINDEDVNAVVYKIDYFIGSKLYNLHEIAFFMKTQEGIYKYNYKYNLSHCSSKDIFLKLQNNSALIRQIGDLILHQPAANVVDFSNENKMRIREQIKVMEQQLYKTGGVGIAANQCRELSQPMSIILAGVNYLHEGHVLNALARYPKTLFPQMRYYINPIILEVSSQLEDFNEGCLSVRGPIRASVRRPNWVKIKYQDINGNEYKKIFTGSAARVMLHELDHICNGKVYFQHVVQELSIKQREVLYETINNVLHQRIEAPILSPISLIDRDETGHDTFITAQMLTYFQGVSTDTLMGMLGIIQPLLDKRSARAKL